VTALKAARDQDRISVGGIGGDVDGEGVVGGGVGDDGQVPVPVPVQAAAAEAMAILAGPGTQ
jgi:hypothetical protein